MRKIMKALPALLLATPLLVPGTPAAAQETKTAQAAHYSVNETLVGQLLDDPAAAAILKKLIPTVYANDLFQTSGRDLTLRAIQQYEPEALSDANLAKIQAEFDKIPARSANTPHEGG
jgi:para-nitrobenzyl esterase